VVIELICNRHRKRQTNKLVKREEISSFFCTKLIRIHFGSRRLIAWELNGVSWWLIRWIQVSRRRVWINESMDGCSTRRWSLKIKVSDRILLERDLLDPIRSKTGTDEAATVEDTLDTSRWHFWEKGEKNLSGFSGWDCSFYRWPHTSINWSREKRRTFEDELGSLTKHYACCQPAWLTDLHLPLHLPMKGEREA